MRQSKEDVTSSSQEEKGDQMTNLKKFFFAVLLATVACGKRPAADPAYVEEIEKVRATRVERLTAENGWLTLVGLHWLKPGSNSFGSDPANTILLKAPQIPPRAGVFDVQPGGTVILSVDPGAPVLVNEGPAQPVPIVTDRDGKPDTITVGRLRLAVIERGDQLAVRVRDPESEARKSFKEIRYFPVDAKYRVEAVFEPFPEAREAEMPSAQGPPQKMLAPGVLRFSLDGKQLSLQPFLEAPDDDAYFIVFQDETAGKETYGAGRFLSAKIPKTGTSRVVLDFNRATNPPCAFTPYATCPLPLPQNILAVRIEAGEKVPEGH